MRDIKTFIQNNREKIFLLAMLIATVGAVIKGKIDYNKRQNQERSIQSSEIHNSKGGNANKSKNINQ